MRDVYDYAAIKRRVAELEARPLHPAPQQPPPPKITRGEDNEENTQSRAEKAGAEA